MASHQMRAELIQLMKGTVYRFNISSETYYHAVLLFNVIQLKKSTQKRHEYFTIPIKKRNICQDSGNGSDYENDNFTEPKTQYVTLHHSQMPEKDKLDLTVCLFLVHKLYQPYPLSLSYLMEHLEIDERFEEYIISLEMEFLVKLAYKIENLLPSNEAIFACHLWDEFTQNIDPTCIDVRFGINEIFQSSKKQIQTSHQINKANIQPEFKTIQTQQSFNNLSRNIQILVHNRAIYDLYIKKSAQQGHDDISSMKKIGLAITYVTIQQQTRMIFNKKYSFNQKENSGHFHQKNQYLEFVFNDFLDQNYGFNLNHLKEEIRIIHSILSEKTDKKNTNSLQRNNKIPSIQQIKDSSPNQFIKFLLRPHEKPILHQHHHKYHAKCKENMSISSTKTEKQPEALQSLCTKGKSYSILGKRSITGKNKHLQSTLHQSNISEKAQSFRGSIYTNKSGSSKIKNLKLKGSYAKKMQKSSEVFGCSYERSNRGSTLKIDSNKHRNSETNSREYQESHERHYRVSQFVSTDI